MKKFEAPEMEVMMLAAEDILTTSNNTCYTVCGQNYEGGIY